MWIMCKCVWQTCYIKTPGKKGQAIGKVCLARSIKNTQISQSTWQAIRQIAIPANNKQRRDDIIRLEQAGVQNATLRAREQVKQMYAASTIETTGVKASARGRLQLEMKRSLGLRAGHNQT